MLGTAPGRDAASARACAACAGLGPASLVPRDVSMLYFETGARDGSRGERALQETPAGPADHHRPVTDAGMSSEASQEIEAAGLPFVLGMRTPPVPYLAAGWRREHPREEIPDGQVSIARTARRYHTPD
jgi:hypothetical protein